MKKNKNNDRNFELILNYIKMQKNNNIVIGEREKEIAKLQNDNERLFGKLRIASANYFTKEKIAELHQKTVDLLKTNDFDEQMYIDLFSDSSTIRYENIDFLVERQKSIEQFEQLKDCNNQTRHKKSAGLLNKLANILMKDGTPND